MQNLWYYGNGKGMRNCTTGEVRVQLVIRLDANQVFSLVHHIHHFPLLHAFSPFCDAAPPSRQGGGYSGSDFLLAVEVFKDCRKFVMEFRPFLCVRVALAVQNGASKK